MSNGTYIGLMFVFNGAVQLVVGALMMYLGRFR